uniref:Bestrophin homolog n=1 Tax=Schistocephalus solidus TaxID=70667 RepID=A0A0V0JBM2_SCHSO
MSVSYLEDVSQGSGFFILLKLLARWKGSLYKLVWLDLTIYLIIYYLIHIIYRYALSFEQKQTFNTMVVYCEDIAAQLPVSFVLGFFVSGIINRWFQTFMHIPWLHEITYNVMAAVNGADPRVSRKIRHCVMRYLNLAWILTMRRISDRIADRFHRQINATSGSPKNSNKSIIRGQNGIWSVSQNSNAKKPVQKRNKSGNKITPVTASPLEVQPNSEIFHLNENDNTFNETDEWSIKETLRCFNNDKIVQATFGAVILEKEINAFEEIARQHFQKTHKRYIPEAWIPIQWAVRLINKAGLHANITDPKLIPNVIKDIGKFRQQLEQLQIFSGLTMPLVYTQVAVISVYSYILCQIISTQHVDRNETIRVINETNVLPLPIFGIVHFLFLLGWLKVALCVMNPFGDDYEDFECSKILDSNLDVSYGAVLLDEATFPESLKLASFVFTPMNGADEDNLPNYIESVTKELKETELTETANDIKNLELRQNLPRRILRYCRANHSRAILSDHNESDTTRLPNPLNY